jgi:hypothetical protein
MDAKNLAIGVLSVTATVLLVGNLVVVSLPAPAVAVGQIDRGGDYIMVTSQFNTSTELVFIVDGAAGRMAAYAYDFSRRIIQVWDAVELNRFMGPPAGQAPIPPRR